MPNMSTPNEELFQFLAPDGRDDLKFISLTHLVGMTDTDDGKRIFTENPKFIDSFISLTDDKVTQIQKQSFAALINLSANDELASHIATKYEKDFMLKLTFHILDDKYALRDEACMLLANLTRPIECTEVAANCTAKHEGHDIITQFIDTICSGKSSGKEVNCHHLFYVLSNLSRIAEVSDRLVNSGGLLKKLLPFIQYKDSLTVRRGVAALVRNCCLNTEYHGALLAPDTDLLPALLVPLAGPEEFDEDDNDKLPVDLQYLEPGKTREPDAEIRRLLVESVNQLCATKFGRKYVKDKNAYVIFRELHRWEEDRQNSLAILKVVDVLIGDEPGEKYEDLKSVSVPDDLKVQFDKDDEEFLKD